MKHQTVIINWGKAIWKWAGPFQYFRNGTKVEWADVPLPVRYLFSEEAAGNV